jgi:hypothetical protein
MADWGPAMTGDRDPAEAVVQALAALLFVCVVLMLAGVGAVMVLLM